MGCNVVAILVLAQGCLIFLGVVVFFVTAIEDVPGGRSHAHKIEELRLPGTLALSRWVGLVDEV